MSMSIHTPAGSPVVFTNRGGWPWERSAYAAALEAGRTYTVAAVHVFGYRTEVEMEGVAGLFNSCVFDNATSPSNFEVE